MRTSPQSPAGLAAPEKAASPRVWDRHLCLALLLTTLIVLPRSLAITAEHSETCDEWYHLSNGLAFLDHDFGYLVLNDPPLGSALSALPVWLAGCHPNYENHYHPFDGQPLTPEAIRTVIALWRSLLYLPLVGVAFEWCRRLYGLRSAWLVCVILALEPNFAGHVPLCTLDVLAVEGIVISCFLAWRYFERPGPGRLAAAAVALAFALLVKHTAILLPGVVLIYALLHWVVRPQLRGQSWTELRSRLPRHLKGLVVGGLLVVVAMWMFLFFDVRHVRVESTGGLLRWPLPCATYIETCLSAGKHVAEGHGAYLLGMRSTSGWWYYFPVVATYKVPLAVAFLLLLTLLSLRPFRPRWEEWGLLVPLLAWGAWMLTVRINIGFRHVLPAYIFLLLLAARCAAVPGKFWVIGAVAGSLALAVDAARYHPDYLCYLNWPRARAYRDISDSNVDWGQSLKQVGVWLDQHPCPDRDVYLLYFSQPYLPYKRYVGDRVRSLRLFDPRPTRGLLIISPVWMAGAYDPDNLYAALCDREPVAVIGHCMLVFDMEELGGGQPFVWP
jgi:hypothetical protein